MRRMQTKHAFYALSMISMTIASVIGCGGGSKVQFGATVPTTSSGKSPAQAPSEVTETASAQQNDSISASTDLTPEEVANYRSVLTLLDAAKVDIPDDIRRELVELDEHANPKSDTEGESLALFGFGGRNSSTQSSGSTGRSGVRSFNLSARTTNFLARAVGIVPASVLIPILESPLGGVVCFPNGLLLITNPFGTALDINGKGNCTRVNGAFIKKFGNGRSCMSCHSPLDTWSINTKNVNQRFNASRGNDPLFRPVDGANCPKADVSTLDAKRQSYSLLLSKGLIRVEMPVPATAEFKLMAYTGTYCNQIDREKPVLSLYRRPLPTTNLHTVTTLMWDGRDSITNDLHKDLIEQARHATMTHAEAKVAPSQAELEQMVSLETSIVTAQITSNYGFSLSTTPNQNASQVLAAHKLIPNENLSPFNPNVFTLFDAFAKSTNAEQKALYRGQQIFNTKKFAVTGMGASVTCSTCHNAPNVGNNTAVPGRFFNNGIAEEEYRTRDIPLYTLASSDGTKTVKVSDPGRALVTGKWEDIGKFKVPTLRGLADREPYFHNGSAAKIEDLVEFYNERFELDLNLEEKMDLTKFLLAL